MRNYIKKKFEKAGNKGLTTILSTVTMLGNRLHSKKVIIASGILLAALPLVFAITTRKDLSVISLDEEGTIQLASAPAAAAVGKKSVIAIPAGTTKANPFLPYRDINATAALTDVPAYTLVEPPDMLDEGSDSARVMDTVVSGILYDKFSPSAILNIEGNDYLVKKGDIVNNYKVVNIMQDSVTVKLGANVYKAGIGEILTEGTLNHNEVSNLNNKFGGERRQ